MGPHGKQGKDVRRIRVRDPAHPRLLVPPTRNLSRSRTARPVSRDMLPKSESPLYSVSSESIRESYRRVPVGKIVRGGGSWGLSFRGAYSCFRIFLPNS